ncbi:EAL domain-containing protein [Myxosarcina sp. GI1(2024)]
MSHNTLLVVEDETIVAQDLQAILEFMGYGVPAIADSGESAIEKAAQLKPDLILMDIRLIGDMDGITAANVIYQNFDIPIIYVTAHSDPDTLKRAKISQPFGYILKPFQEQEIKIAIEIALYKHQVERQLRESQKWLSTVLDSIGDGVITTDTHSRTTSLNAVAEQITGWTSPQAVGKNLLEVFNLINEISRKVIVNPIETTLATGEILHLPKHTLLVNKNGREIPIEATVTSIKDNKNSNIGVVIVFRDVSQQRLVAKKLHRQAYYDSLTNLANRVWFNELLTDAIERVKRNSDYLFGVLLLDLDRFKVVNDSLGHLIGDRLLAAVASRLENSVRPNDTVARLGGDEFAILLESLQDESEGVKVARRIQQELIVTFNIEGREIYTSTSIGIVLSSIGYQRIEEVMRDADMAMYRAKAKGRNCYEIFDPITRDSIAIASQLENELRGAIERKELTIYYQPIVSLVTRSIVGFEALVRWHHSQWGAISPAEFIPIAEESGLIFAIDWWVLREACRQMKVWQQRQRVASSAKISVNLSSKLFLQTNLIEKIEEIVRTTGLSPRNLRLEITESAMMIDPDLAAIFLLKLRKFGIDVSLDDFGTGYSSLSYLHRFPVSSIKIDRSFISKIDSEPESLEIVRAIVALGKNLQLDVVAEGIETLKQLHLLQNLECQYGQGFLFSAAI